MHEFQAVSAADPRIQLGDESSGGTRSVRTWLVPAHVQIPPALPGCKLKTRGQIFSSWIVFYVGIAATARPNPELLLPHSQVLSTMPLPQTLSAALPAPASQSPPSTSSQNTSTWRRFKGTRSTQILLTVSFKYEPPAVRTFQCLELHQTTAPKDNRKSYKCWSR